MQKISCLDENIQDSHIPWLGHIQGFEISRRFPKGGLIGPKKLGDFWVFSLIFNAILMPNWGFNYSKMAEYRFLIDSNTFWMDFGTWKISIFFGPVVDPRNPYLS